MLTWTQISDDGCAKLDHYQVRVWRAWYAHMTLSMLALVSLGGQQGPGTKGDPAPASRA